MADTQIPDKCGKIGPFWLFPPPPEKRCTARSKRTGKRCQQWAMRGKAVCYYHGGRSSGPKTKQGRASQQRAVTKHGKYSLDELKRRMLFRIGKRLLGNENPAWHFDYFQRKLLSAEMNYTRFRKTRPYLVKFIRGELGIEELAKYLDNKKPL